MALYIIRDGEREGPYTPEEIGAMLAEGRLSRDDMVAEQDWPEPVPLSQLITEDAPTMAENVDSAAIAADEEPPAIAEQEELAPTPAPPPMQAPLPHPAPDPRFAARKLPKGKIIDPHAPPPKSTAVWWFLIMVLGGIAIIWFLLRDDVRWRADAGASAFRESRILITNSLKNPGTAKFSKPSGADCGWEALDGGDYRCWGRVEFQGETGEHQSQEWETRLAPLGDFWRPVYCRLGKEVFFDSRKEK